MNGNSDFPDRLVRRGLINSGLAAATDAHYGQLRHEVRARAQGDVQSAQESHLRRVAAMETGRALNVSVVA